MHGRANGCSHLCLSGKPDGSLEGLKVLLIRCGNHPSIGLWVSLERLKSVQKDGRVWNTYSLKVENEERVFKTEALVEEEAGCGLIRDKKFKVI